jgi:hypothetical protein
MTKLVATCEFLSALKNPGFVCGVEASHFGRGSTIKAPEDARAPSLNLTIAGGNSFGAHLQNNISSGLWRNSLTPLFLDGNITYCATWKSQNVYLTVSDFGFGAGKIE